MTYTHLNDEGQFVTHYTDGLVMVNHEYNTFPGVEVVLGAKNKANYFSLSEGLWYMPYPYRLCVYTPREIYDTEGFLDIDKRVNSPSGYLRLEKEIEMECEKGLITQSNEIFYDISFMDEKQLYNVLYEDLSLFDKGNLNMRFNKIEIIDKVFT